jgi:hypothetical protein
MALPKTVKEAHPRTFPGNAFLPSGLRPLNREVLRACFLNAVFEVSNKGLESAHIRQALQQSVLQGDASSIDYAMSVLDEVLFPSSKSMMGNSKANFRVTHPRLGRIFTPDQHYGAPEWIRAFFHHAEFLPETIERLRGYLALASERPLNVLELAAYEAIMTATQGHVTKAMPLDATVARRLAPTTVLRQFRELVEARLESADARAHAKGPIEAEGVVFDIARAYEIHLWFYWVQMYLDAWSALGALRRGESPDSRIHTIHFGYHTERVATKGRPFATERVRLEDEVYKGTIATIALANVHEALDLQDPFWFTEIEAIDGSVGKDGGGAKLRSWLARYKELVEKEKGRGLNAEVADELTPSRAIPAYYDAIAEYYRSLAQNSRMPYTTTFGVVRSLGCADDCPLLINLGTPRGLVTMIDHSLILLIGRMLSRGERRVRFNLIVDQLERIGMRLDDTTQEHIVADLEQKGLLQSLSDSGDAIYVQVH